VGAGTRLMLAVAITNARTNFFIQCSWEFRNGDQSSSTRWLKTQRFFFDG